MTERVLRLPPGAGGATTARTQAVPHGGARVAAGSRRPVHVAIAVGVTAGVYAISLAGVTALQAGTDARLAAERAPAGAAVDALRASHDAAESDLARISAAYADTAATYQRVADEIASHEAGLGTLAASVATIEGSAASLRVPTVARLPSVSTRTVVVSRPATHACTTASGKAC